MVEAHIGPRPHSCFNRQHPPLALCCELVRRRPFLSIDVFPPVSRSPCRIRQFKASESTRSQCGPSPSLTVRDTLLISPARWLKDPKHDPRLFRRILRAHRCLPYDMRSLGDVYVKSGLWCHSLLCSLRLRRRAHRMLTYRIVSFSTL